MATSDTEPVNYYEKSKASHKQLEQESMLLEIHSCSSVDLCTALAGPYGRIIMKCLNINGTNEIISLHSTIEVAGQ